MCFLFVDSVRKWIELRQLITISSFKEDSVCLGIYQLLNEEIWFKWFLKEFQGSLGHYENCRGKFDFGEVFLEEI